MISFTRENSNILQCLKLNGIQMPIILKITYTNMFINMASNIRVQCLIRLNELYLKLIHNSLFLFW